MLVVPVHSNVPSGTTQQAEIWGWICGWEKGESGTWIERELRQLHECSRGFSYEDWVIDETYSRLIGREVVQKQPDKRHCSSDVRPTEGGTRY